MGFMDNLRNKMQSWLQINPPIAMTINIQEVLDWQGNCIKNKIWYRGDPNELEQLYWQIPKHQVERQKFWASYPTPGQEMRKIHTGLPAIMVDTLAGIIKSNLNDFAFEGDAAVKDLWDNINDENHIKQLLEKEIPLLEANIRALYKELDKKFHLSGANIPITFGFDKDVLGSYTRAGMDEEEHFHFSLLFVGYAVNNPLSKEDRMDLYKHEYAHYMAQNMEIPKEYTWQPGLHGRA